MRKIAGWTVTIVALGVLAFVIHFYLPKDVSIDTQGIKYRLGQANAEETKAIRVRVDGKMYRSLTGNRTFRGTVEIEGEEWPVPDNQRVTDIRFYKGNWGVLVYAYNDAGKPFIHQVGSIYINRSFSRMTIAILEEDGDGGSWTGEDGLMITAPAADRAEAVAVSNALMKPYLRGYRLE